MVEAFAKQDCDAFVIDLRHNTGGSSLVINPLLNWLSRGKAEREFKLYVLTSSTTFSSGMMNAHQLRDQAGATLVGQPTGGRPNHFGEVSRTQLPNSKIPLGYSTKRFNNVPGNHDSVRPQKMIPLTAKDYFRGKDAVIEWIAKQH